MTFGSFGLDKIDKPGPIDLLGESVRGSIDPWKRELALRELYETLYGVFDHNSEEAKSRPLALVASHPKDNSTAYSPLMHRIEEYLILKLFEKTGIPLDRFLEMPVDYVREILAIAKRELHTESKSLAAASNSLDAAVRETREALRNR